MSSPHRSPSLVAVGLLVILIVLWGGNYTWVKIAVRDIGPWTFNAVRYLAAAVLIAGVLTAVAGREALLPVRGERMPLAIVGLLQAAVTTGASALALQWIEASRVVLIIYSMPIWTLPLSMVLLGERATAVSVLGAVLGLLGIAALTSPWSMAWTADALPGLLLSLVGVLGWALGAVLYRRRRWTSGFWQQTFWQVGAAAVAMLPVAVLLEAGRPVTPSAAMLAITAYNTVGPIAFGFWCWSQALARMSATAASQILLLSPVFGVLQSHVVLGEPLGPSIVLATASIVLGAWLALIGRKPG